MNYNFDSDRQITFKIKLKSNVAYLCDGDLCNDDKKNLWKITSNWIQGQGIRHLNLFDPSSD